MTFDVTKTAAPALSIMIEGDGFRYQATNDACFAVSGLSARAVAGLTPHDCFPNAVADTVVARYRTCRDNRQPLSFMTAVGPPLGTACFQTTLVPMVDQTGRVVSLVAFFLPATQDAPIPKPADSLGDKVSLAIDAIDAGFWVYEIKTGTFETSRSLAELLAGPGHSSLNLDQYARFVHPEDFRPNELLNPAALQGKVDYRVVTHEREIRWLQSKRHVIRDDRGETIRIVSLVVDITEQKTALQTLENEASTDCLTGLNNRRAFDRIAARVFGHRQPALLLIDLDGFKPINDRHGHHAGDQILRKVARRLERCVRKGDILARVGGDEFAILVQAGAGDVGATLTTRIGRMFDRPFTLGRHSIFVGVSTGLALMQPNDRSMADLFRRADRALYAMKSQRRLLTA